MFSDLGEILVPGFLSTSIDIENHRYCLRSLSQNDLYFLHKYVRDDDPAWRIHLIAQSVWMVDGIPLLEDSTLAHRVVYDHLMRSSRVLVREMLGTVYGFFARMRETNHYLEAYLYEEDSRRLWRGIGSGTYPLSSKTAIPGVDRIGLNPFQSAWLSWNHMEDDHEAQESVWANTKVLVSLQSHKGYESLNNKDRQRQETENGWRASVRERAQRRFLYGEDPEEAQKALGETVQKARSTDELEDEMRRWIRGDMDWHDQIVENYKNRIRQEQARREEEKTRIMAELRARREETEHDLGVPKPLLRPITPEQMEKMRRSSPTTGARYIVEADPVSRAFNRYLRPTVESGNLSVDASGKIVEAPPNVKEPVSLTEQIAGRKVVLDEVQS